MNRIITGEEARSIIRKGVDETANIVKLTYGAKGRNVIVARPHMLPYITKDGVTVAKEAMLDDEIANIGAYLIKQVAARTDDGVKDGPQPLYSKILTPSGWTTMGEIKEGDEICGTNGSIQKVVGVFPKGGKKIYKVKFSDGRVVECCEDHLWSVLNNRNTKKTLTVREMIKTGIVKFNNKGGKRYTFYVPTTKVEFEENSNNLSLQPYLVGLLLGDGSLNSRSITLTIGYNKEHALDKIILPEGISFTKKDWKERNCIEVRFSGLDINGKSLRSYLKELGLSEVKSATKFIPKNYLYSSLKSREELLQGLLDTDGSVNKRGRFEYSTISDQLALDFIELCRSLDKNLHIRKLIRKESSSYSNTPIHRIYELKGYKNGIKIIDIEETDEYTEMQCIKVSNPDNLYITDNYIVTHNTTTATILAQAIVNEADSMLKQGVNPVYVKRGIDKAMEFAVKKLKTLSTRIKTNTELRNIATISANGDKEIGKLIAEIYKKTGKDGVIKVEEGLTTETTVEYTKGYEIDNGFLNWGFINNHEKNQVEFEDCYVLLYEGYLEELKELDKTIETLYDEQTGEIAPLLIISDNIDTQIINKFLAYKMHGKKLMCIKSPSFGSRRTEMMQDITTVIGGKVYSKERGLPLEEVTLEGLGKIKKFICDADKTVLIGGQGQGTEERIQTVKNQIKAVKSKKDKDFTKERLAKLSGGVVVINVGGYSDVEIKEKIDRVDDALGATRASLEEGFVPGGGITYLELSKALKELKLDNKDEQKGVDIISNALVYPFKQILENGGLDYKKCISSLKEGQGVNIDNEQLVYMASEGIIDPAKVTRTALENAASIASTFLTTDGIVWRDEEIINSRSEM